MEIKRFYLLINGRKISVDWESKIVDAVILSWVFPVDFGVHFLNHWLPETNTSIDEPI